jgi:hypothetical protein
MVSISLNDLDNYLNKAKSQFKSLDFENLDREKNNCVSTLRTISISIGLGCQDHQA